MHRFSESNEAMGEPSRVEAHLTREFQRFGGFTPGQRLPATLVTLPLGGVAD